jgi:hypothetical protein
MLVAMPSNLSQATCTVAFGIWVGHGNCETNDGGCPMNREIETRFPLLGGIAAHDPMTEKELRAIEKNLGEGLPEDFREFSQTYGAASFGELVEFQLMEAHPVHAVQGALTPIPQYEKAPFSHFYGSTKGNQSLARKIEIYKERMPDKIIPIADDGGGNQICLGIKGKERGKVYYWDHHNDPNEEEYLEDYGKPMPPEVKFQNVYLIAESFEGFIRRLEKHENS